MKLVWKNSRLLAAVSYILASHQSHLSPDQAMLAGLIHDIGVLPLCLYIEKHHSKIDEETLNDLIQNCSNIIGTKLLQKWNPPPIWFRSQPNIAIFIANRALHRSLITLMSWHAMA